MAKKKGPKKPNKRRREKCKGLIVFKDEKQGDWD